MIFFESGGKKSICATQKVSAQPFTPIARVAIGVTFVRVGFGQRGWESNAIQNTCELAAPYGNH